MSVTSAGVGSGLDLEGLIRPSVQAESAPKLASIQRRETSVNAQLSSIGKIKSDLNSFKTSLDTLKELSSFQNRTATIKQPTAGDVISVTAADTATAGKFDIKVTQLAQGSRAVQADGAALSSVNDVVTASGGTLTLTAGSKTFDVTLAAGATLADLRTAINDKADNFGVSANIINTGGANSKAKLVLTSNETGDNNNLAVTANTAELNNFTTTQPGALEIGAADEARNAKIEIDGIETTSTSNTFENAVQDITIRALREDTANSATLTVANDEEGIRKTLDGFVTNFNALMKTLDASIQNRSSEVIARSLQRTLINDISGVVSGAGNFSSVFDIGIELKKDNQLGIKTSGVNTLTKAFENFDDIGKLFAGANGIATKLSSTTDLYLETSGIIKTEEDSLNLQKKSLVKERSDANFRTQQFEKGLRERFASLDVLIAGLRSQGASINSSLANLPGFTRS